MKVGALMQAVRERAGYSQEKLAEIMNRTQSCISKIETDRKMPDLVTFMTWIEATGAKEVAVAFLCGMDGLRIMQDLMTLIGG
ncbi:helix-turn-helix domain-containing protein [Paenibacillus campinasensis]|uniref:Helix-turn-helix domain-containing protein n=1 Tax=Paenibacillus campinasensis TaxID=66347 RepID=A0ABW9T5R1_9BACL|nr:helix-turn-helix transcriptional regulator [Paenibacillus campinasensis]MUG68665.1 helix-turn-helix domain-containing protein [Paenibacillus campinasensis]